MKWIFVAIFYLTGPGLWALDIEADFSSFDSDVEFDLIWDHPSSRLIPPVEIGDYVPTAGVTLSAAISVGNGSHGVFDSSTYADFSENGEISGSTISINTDTYPELNFTSFHLGSGWTIRPTGSNPLVIYSLGDVIIEGEINCSGEDGEEFIADATSQASGGGGVCGGGDGGRAASAIAGEESSAGTSLFSGPTGGGGATGQTSGSGGGGGGAFTETTGGRDAEAGDDIGAGTGGTAGALSEDHDFDASLGGGAGGGGGAAYTAGASGQNASGGGGGAGGGSVIIHALGKVEIYPTGGVYANGGDGGGTDSPGTYLSGGGGGGGGGSIRIVSAGDEVYASGPVEADSGAGGDNGSAGGSGGKGAEGRTWVVGASGFSVALPPNALVPESPASLLADVGATRFQTGTFTWTSSVIDTESTRPEIADYDITSSLSGSSSVSLLLAFSSEGSSFSGFTDVSSVSEVGDRYLKYQIQLVNDDSANGGEVTAASIEVTPFTQEDFEFEGGCGKTSGLAGGAPPARLPVILVLLLLFLPIAFALKLRSGV